MKGKQSKPSSGFGKAYFSVNFISNKFSYEVDKNTIRMLLQNMRNQAQTKSDDIEKA